MRISQTAPRRTVVIIVSAALIAQLYGCNRTETLKQLQRENDSIRIVQSGSGRWCTTFLYYSNEQRVASRFIIGVDDNELKPADCVLDYDVTSQTVRVRCADITRGTFAFFRKDVCGGGRWSY